MPTLTSASTLVRISPQGAELSSLRHAETGLEYLWQADPAVWGRHAPLLFPIVGKLPDDTYLHHGRAYRLPQHGFARDREFAVLRQTDTEAVFQLRDDAASRAVYPFAFVLTVGYELRDNRLTVRWTVQNPAADADLLFSIGAHPAFRCPLRPDEQFEDYRLAFDHFVSADTQELEGGLRTGRTSPTLFQEKDLPLTYPLFARDALVFNDFGFEAVTLRSREDGLQVRMEFAGFPYLGIWTKGPGAAFVCIEPWHGVASPVGPPQELAEKEGIIRLAPGAEFAAYYVIEVL